MKYYIAFKKKYNFKDGYENSKINLFLGRWVVEYVYDDLKKIFNLANSNLIELDRDLFEMKVSERPYLFASSLLNPSIS